MISKNSKYYLLLLPILAALVCAGSLIIIGGILIARTTSTAAVAGLFGIKAVISVADIEDVGIKKNDLLFFKVANKSTITVGSIICSLDGGTVRICRVNSLRTESGITYLTVDGIHKSYVIKNKEIPLSTVDSIYTGKKIDGAGSAIQFFQSGVGVLIFIILPISAATFANMLFFGKQSRRERERQAVMEKELMLLRKMSSSK